MQEVGRAQRTIFACRYLRDRELQREVGAGLNVGESWNGGNSVVYFGKGGSRPRWFVVWPAVEPGRTCVVHLAGCSGRQRSWAEIVLCSFRITPPCDLSRLTPRCHSFRFVAVPGSPIPRFLAGGKDYAVRRLERELAMCLYVVTRW